MPLNKEAHAEYIRRKYHERRAEAIERLGGKCSRCSSIDRLEIDHIDPKEKEIPLNRLWSVSKKRYEQELKKCQLLCYSCHRKKSINDLGKKPRRHGSNTMYRRGCRCDPCRKAHSAACLRSARKRKLRGVRDEHV